MRKQIKNYDNYYIYDTGDVLNITTNKILKGSIGENGYKYYRLSKNNKNFSYCISNNTKSSSYISSI